MAQRAVVALLTLIGASHAALEGLVDTGCLNANGNVDYFTGEDRGSRGLQLTTEERRGNRNLLGQHYLKWGDQCPSLDDNVVSAWEVCHLIVGSRVARAINAHHCYIALQMEDGKRYYVDQNPLEFYHPNGVPDVFYNASMPTEPAMKRAWKRLTGQPLVTGCHRPVDVAEATVIQCHNEDSWTAAHTGKDATLGPAARTTEQLSIPVGYRTLRDIRCHAIDYIRHHPGPYKLQAQDCQTFTAEIYYDISAYQLPRYQTLELSCGCMGMTATGGGIMTCRRDRGVSVPLPVQEQQMELTCSFEPGVGSGAFFAMSAANEDQDEDVQEDGIDEDGVEVQDKELDEEMRLLEQDLKLLYRPG